MSDRVAVAAPTVAKTVVVIDSVTAVGDEVSIAGHVGGTTVSAKCWRSHLDKLPDDAARQTYIAGLLAKVAAPVPPKSLDTLVGTFQI